MKIMFDAHGSRASLCRGHFPGTLHCKLYTGLSVAENLEKNMLLTYMFPQNFC